jgi:hypothetical protein
VSDAGTSVSVDPQAVAPRSTPIAKTVIGEEREDMAVLRSKGCREQGMRGL